MVAPAQQVKQIAISVFAHLALKVVIVKKVRGQLTIKLDSVFCMFMEEIVPDMLKDIS